MPITQPPSSPAPIEAPARWRIKPALGNILVKPLEDDDEKRTKAGLILIAPIVEKDTHVCEVAEVCDAYSSALDDRSIARDGPIYSVGEIVIIGKYNRRD